ncbi:MAG: competence/damage-inducible protein A [Blastocatellia bacterium]
MATVEILAVGNEILLGLIQDTNPNYLSRVVTARGGCVRRAAIVRDEESEIVAEINGSLARGPDLIFTCGGLGPTLDDLTIAAVAKAVGRNLALHADAKKFVEHRYESLAEAGYVAGPEMTKDRLKMAMLPEQAKMIANPVGAAPGVLIELNHTKIVSLPGVPAELKAIVEGPLQPLLISIFGAGSYREREILVDCGDESVLAPLLSEVVSAHPNVYIKSHASHFGPEVKFRIQLSATGSNAVHAEEKIAKAEDDLTRTFERGGIRVLEK